jgi:hypothetical protein
MASTQWTCIQKSAQYRGIQISIREIRQLTHNMARWVDPCTRERIGQFYLLVFYCHVYFGIIRCGLKIKIKLSLCLTQHHAMNTYWDSGSIAPRILDLGTRWKWVVSFTPRPLYTQGNSPGTHWIGGWVGPRAVLDAVVKRKIPSPRRESKPRTPVVQPVAQRYAGSNIWICTVR